MRNYGYRLFPNEVIYTSYITGGSKCTISTKWINRGVGRALKDFNLLIKFKDASGNLLGQQDLGLTGSYAWVKNNTYTLLKNFTMPVITPGDYTLCIGLFDSSRSGKMIELPMDNKTTDGFYPIGKFTVSNVGDTCKPLELTGIAVSPKQINLSWADKCNVESEYVVERKIPFWPNPQFEELTRLPANSQFYIDSQLVANTGYTYRVKVYQNKNLISTSNEFYLPTLNPNLFDAAYHAGTTQSSTLFGLTSDKVTDGFACGQDGPFTYAHTNTEANPWWEVDLGAVYFVKEIQVWNRSSCCINWLSNYSVFTSVNPFISNDYIATKNQIGVDNFYQTSIAQRPTTFAVNNSARYVRIQLSGSNYLVLNEVVVIADQTTVGIENVDNTSTLKIYPNPVKDILLVELQCNNHKMQNSGKFEFLITDLQGRIVYTEIVNTIEVIQEIGYHQTTLIINTCGLQPGVYFLQIRSNENAIVRKFIKG